MIACTLINLTVPIVGLFYDLRFDGTVLSHSKPQGLVSTNRIGRKLPSTVSNMCCECSWDIECNKMLEFSSRL